MSKFLNQICIKYFMFTMYMQYILNYPNSLEKAETIFLFGEVKIRMGKMHRKYRCMKQKRGCEYYFRLVG